MQGELSGGSGLRILPRCFPVPPSLPQLPPFLPCAELRVTSCSETEGFFSSIFKEAAEEPGEALPPSCPPRARRRQLLRGSPLGRAPRPAGPCPQRRAGCQPLLPALCPLAGCSAALGCPPCPGIPAEAEVRSCPWEGRCPARSLSLEGCELLSSGCWFSPKPLRLVFSASPRCRWLQASELSALLTRARKSALTASGHCVGSGNWRRGAEGERCPGGTGGCLSSPSPKSCAAHGHRQVLSAPGCPRAPDGRGLRLGSAVLWPLSLCPHVLITKGQGVGFCSGFVWGEMGLGAACGGAALQAATGLAGEDQDRNEQETLIFFLLLLCFWRGKGPVAFYKSTSPNLPGLGLAHREPEGRRRCWWLGGLQTA